MSIEERRAGAWSAQQARRLHLDFLRNRWELVALVLAIFAAGVTVIALLAPDRMRPYVVGAGVASAFWYVALIAVQFAGTTSYLLGAQGEEWTSDGLRKLRRHGWHLIEHLPLEWGDIDHALVGPGGAYAIETKATYGMWNPAEPDERLLRAVHQAREEAKRLHFLLTTRDIQLRVEVRPLLVLWGPTMGYRERIDNVEIVHGSVLRDWRQSLADGVLTAEEVKRAAAGLHKYVEIRDKRIREAGGRTPLLVRVGPSAILGALTTAVLGGASALVALGVGVRLTGDRWFLPMLGFLLAGGAALRKASRLRILAAGWMTAGIAVAVVMAGLYLAHWTGLL